MWALAPSKIALEQLFMEGKLMIARRQNFHKVYELRERVLPDNIDRSEEHTSELQSRTNLVCRLLLEKKKKKKIKNQTKKKK